MKPKLSQRPSVQIIMSILSGLLGIGFLWTMIESIIWNVNSRIFDLQRLSPEVSYIIFGFIGIVFLAIVIFSIVSWNKVFIPKRLVVLLSLATILVLTLWFIFKTPPSFMAAIVLLFYFSYVMAKDAKKGLRERKALSENFPKK